MIDLIIVLIYLGITLLLGIFSHKGKKNLEEYAVADREFPLPLLIATVGASLIGGGATLGSVEQYYKVGILYLFVCFARPLYKTAVAYLVVPRMERFKDAISTGEVMKELYGEPGQLVAGISGALLCMGASGAQITGIGYMFQFLLDVPFSVGVFLGFGVVIIYAVIGGIRSVVVTDTLQFAALVLVFPIVASVGLNMVGGFNGLFEKIPPSYLTFFPDFRLTLKYVGMFFALGTLALDPMILHRILMARNKKQVSYTFKLIAFFDVILLITLCIIGFLTIALLPGVEPGQAALTLVDQILPVGLKGFIAAGMLAVLMSTVDSYLNTASVLVTRDIIQTLSKKKLAPHTEYRFAQIIIVFLGFGGVLAALYFQSILELAVATTVFWCAAVLIPFYAGIFGLKASIRAFLVGMVTGILGAITWRIFFSEITGLGPELPSMITNAAGFFFVHFMIDKNPTSFFEQRKLNNELMKDRDLSHLLFDKLNSAFSVVKRYVHGLFKPVNHGAEPPYFIFGVFAALNYMFPYFIWTASHPTVVDLGMILRISGASMCLVLVSKDTWPEKAKRYLPAFGFFVFVFYLPFTSTFLFLQNNASPLWACQLCLSILLLGMMLDWERFIAALIIGSVLGTIMYAVNFGYEMLFSDELNIGLVIYILIYSATIGFLFSRHKDQTVRLRIDFLKTLAGTLAHEMRTPLASVGLFATALEETLPKIVSSSDTNSASPGNARATTMQLELLQGVPENLKKISQRTSLTVEMLMMQLKDEPIKPQMKQQSIASLIGNAMDTYPFAPNEKNKVSIDVKNDFSVFASENWMVHVFYNLMKNALREIENSKKGSIEIWCNRTGMYNEVHVRDTASGISQADLPYIFDSFFSRSKSGTGLGLAFCKKVMMEHGGDITCRSEIGEYTHFVMTFPAEIA